MKNFILLFVILFAFNTFAKKITDDNLILGVPGASSNIDIKDPSGDIVLRFDRTEQKLKFSNDAGANFLDIGSGGGGGSGSLNVLVNANAEQGLSNISNVGGSLTEITTLANVLEGKKSFGFDPASQNDVVKFDAVTLSEGLIGTSCEARVKYIGGDENSIIEVVDANALVIGSTQMKTHSINGFESVWFRCPNSTEIGGDANKGILTLQVRQSEVTNGAGFTFDENHLGGLIGLVEVTTPDVFSYKVSGAGVVTDDESGMINSPCAKVGGNYECSYNAGKITSIPNCNVTPAELGGGGTNGMMAYIVYEGTDKLSYEISRHDATNLSNTSARVVCQKTGDDAKQQVQVYKSIPKVSELINDFTANITSGAVVSSESTTFIDSVTFGAGVLVVNYAGLGLTEIPTTILNAEHNPAGSTLTYGITSISTTSVSYTFSQAGTGPVQKNVKFSLSKQGADVVNETVQPIIVGQVRNSAAEANSKNVTVESCRVNNNGTATMDTGSTLCESWLDSVVNTGGGQVSLNITSGIFSSEPVCSGSSDIFNRDFAVKTTSTSLITTHTTDNGGTDNSYDVDFYITCQGVK